MRVVYRKAAKLMLCVEKHMEKEEKCGASFISSYSLQFIESEAKVRRLSTFYRICGLYHFSDVSAVNNCKLRVLRQMVVFEISPQQGVRRIVLMVSHVIRRPRGLLRFLIKTRDFINRY